VEKAAYEITVTAKPEGLAVEINSNGEELGPEQPHRPCIPSTARQLTRQPALTLTGIIVGEQVGIARVSSSPKSLSQFQSYM
jgi:hypothetical protein